MAAAVSARPKYLRLEKSRTPRRPINALTLFSLVVVISVGLWLLALSNFTLVVPNEGGGHEEPSRGIPALQPRRLKTFPPPYAMAGQDSKLLLEPTFGAHRPDKDAVFAFAEGYDLPVYVLFVESLRRTGFDGDIVLSVSSPDKMADRVEDYLRSQSQKGLVVYTVDWDCYKKDGEKYQVRQWNRIIDAHLGYYRTHPLPA